MKPVNTATKVLISFCMLLIFTLSACEQTEQLQEEINLENEQNSITYSFKNPNTGQEFNIIHAYLLYENYFESIKNNPDDTIYKLYKQEIVKPISEACFNDAELVNTYTETIFGMPPKKSAISNIKKQIESMNKDQLNEVFEESLLKSSDILPSNQKTTVCIFPENERALSDMETIHSGEIIVYYNKFHKTFKSGMSHEYHHSVWLRKHVKENYFFTGLEHLILEGQALMFETLVYPELNSAHYVVDERFNKEYWQQIEPYLDSVDAEDIGELILGGVNGLPKGYGYSEGYKIVRSYLNIHSNLTVEEWTSKNPKEIFEEINYIANYE